jgi:hypothetical protein
MTFKQFWQLTPKRVKIILLLGLIWLASLIQALLLDREVWAFYGALIAWVCYIWLGLLDDVLKGKFIKSEKLK